MQQRNNHVRQRPEDLKFEAQAQNSKWGFTQIRNEAFIIPNSKQGLTQSRNEAKVVKFETLGKPKAWAIQRPKFEYKFEYLWISKTIATRFNSSEFVPPSRSFLASQVRVFDVSLSKPRGCDSVRSHVPSFYRGWLLLVTNTWSRELDI